MTRAEKRRFTRESNKIFHKFNDTIAWLTYFKDTGKGIVFVVDLNSMKIKKETTEICSLEEFVSFRDMILLTLGRYETEIKAGFVVENIEIDGDYADVDFELYSFGIEGFKEMVEEGYLELKKDINNLISIINNA